MVFSDIKNKIDCCFAAQVYEKYLKNRYGIMGCKEVGNKNSDDLSTLKQTFDYYRASYLRNDSLDINPATFKVNKEGCDINLLIERINLL